MELGYAIRTVGHKDHTYDSWSEGIPAYAWTTAATVLCRPLWREVGFVLDVRDTDEEWAWDF